MWNYYFYGQRFVGLFTKVMICIDFAHVKRKHHENIIYELHWFYVWVHELTLSLPFI